MRIVGGAWRGRPAERAGRATPPGRPRTGCGRRCSTCCCMRPGRGREALEGARVLDAFAGTGALGLEALSRGAARPAFIERDRAALAALRANIAACGPGARCQRARGRRAAAAAGTAARLVFLDPPYGEGLVPPALAALRAAGWIAPGALVVAELGARRAMRPSPARCWPHCEPWRRDECPRAAMARSAAIPHRTAGLARHAQAQRRPNSRSISARVSFSTVGRPWLQVAARGVASICRSRASISAACRRRPARMLPWQARRASTASSRAAQRRSSRRSRPARRRGRAAAAPGRGRRGRPAARGPAPRRRRTPPARGPARAASSAAASRRRAVGRRQVDHGGQQQRLRPHAAGRVLRRAAPHGSAAHARRAGPPAPGCHPRRPPGCRCRTPGRARRRAGAPGPGAIGAGRRADARAGAAASSGSCASAKPGSADPPAGSAAAAGGPR